MSKEERRIRQILDAAVCRYSHNLSATPLYANDVESSNLVRAESCNQISRMFHYFTDFCMLLLFINILGIQG